MTPQTVARQAPLSTGGSPDKNTGVDCHPLLQGIFPTQGSNPGLPHCRCILYYLRHQGSPRGVGGLYLFPGDLPNPGIKLGSPALQVDSLPAELRGNPCVYVYVYVYIYMCVYIYIYIYITSYLSIHLSRDTYIISMSWAYIVSSDTMNIGMHVSF